jgi:hypothetical protein
MLQRETLQPKKLHLMKLRPKRLRLRLLRMKVRLKNLHHRKILQLQK